MKAAKEVGIRNEGKQFYILVPCHVDFMSHFYWLVNKRGLSISLTQALTQLL